MIPNLCLINGPKDPLSRNRKTSVSKNSHRISFLQPLKQQQPQSILFQIFMIIVRKILRTSLPFHPLLLYFNSTQTNGKPTTETVRPIQLGPEAQRALWANHFINTIINQHIETSIESPSLRDKLIDSPNPTLQHKFDQDIKKEMTGIFTKGENLNQNVFDQDRILNATYKDNRVAFYPSLQVTRPVFRLMHSSGCRQMLQGTFGIGKSISIAFYIYLTNIINSYVLLAARKGDEKMQNEYSDLVRNQYLRHSHRKFWYWSMDWDLVNSEDFSLQRIMAEQATELAKEEREQIRHCKTVKEAQKKIHELYKKSKITHIGVLDQINHAVSFIRKWNQFVQTNQKLIDNANSKRQIQKADLARLNDIYQPTTKIISLAKQFTAINQFHYILNSSLNIERQLLEAKEITYKINPQGQKLYQQLTLQLKYKNRYHQPLNIFALQYKQLLQYQKGRIGFWQFFVSLLEEKIKQDLTEQEFKSFKFAFLQYAITLDLKLCYRFLHVRLFLQSYNFDFLKKISEENKNEITKKIIYDFDKYSFYDFQQNIRKFIIQGDTKFKRSLLRAIYVIASQQKDKTKKLVVDFGLVGKMMERPDLKYTLRQYFVQSQPNKQMIPIEYTQHDSYKINISWSAQDFMLISNKALFEKIFDDRIVLPDHKQYIMRTSNSYSGI